MVNDLFVALGIDKGVCMQEGVGEIVWQPLLLLM